MGSQRLGHEWGTELNWTECMFPFYPPYIPLSSPSPAPPPPRVPQSFLYVCVAIAAGRWILYHRATREALERLIITHLIKEIAEAQKRAWLIPGRTASQQQPESKSSGLWTPGSWWTFPAIPFLWLEGAYTYLGMQLVTSVCLCLYYIWPMHISVYASDHRDPSLPPSSCFFFLFFFFVVVLLVPSSNSCLTSRDCAGLQREREREKTQSLASGISQ